MAIYTAFKDSLVNADMDVVTLKITTYNQSGTGNVNQDIILNNYTEDEFLTFLNGYLPTDINSPADYTFNVTNLVIDVTTTIYLTAVEENAQYKLSGKKDKPSIDFFELKGSVAYQNQIFLPRLYAEKSAKNFEVKGMENKSFVVDVGKTGYIILDTTVYDLSTSFDTLRTNIETITERAFFFNQGVDANDLSGLTNNEVLVGNASGGIDQTDDVSSYVKGTELTIPIFDSNGVLSSNSGITKHSSSPRYTITSSSSDIFLNFKSASNREIYRINIYEASALKAYIMYKGSTASSLPSTYLMQFSDAVGFRVYREGANDARFEIGKNTSDVVTRPSDRFTCIGTSKFTDKVKVEDTINADLPEYTTDALATADSSLSSGDLYIVTGSTTVRQKA